MRAVCPVFPSIGRYFGSVQQLADAACMSRSEATLCLRGKKDFTANQKRAIAANIIVRMERGELETHSGREILDMYSAFDDFDTVFRR